ncbi:MAG TPA: hypothetical protein VNO82_20565 [Solirubrobacteraceae bacterium]|nr:hypothetical protein [Solirubrobacteraceae bacterium]
MIAPLLATLAFTSPAAPQPVVAPAAPARLTCPEAAYTDRTKAPGNAAGLIFRPRGDRFSVWDNVPDHELVHIWFNYSGVADKWKWVGTPSDGGNGTIVRNVSERYRQICFYVQTDSSRYGDSPVARYTTRP